MSIISIEQCRDRPMYGSHFFYATKVRATISMTMKQAGRADSLLDPCYKPSTCCCAPMLRCDGDLPRCSVQISPVLLYINRGTVPDPYTQHLALTAHLHYAHMIDDIRVYRLVFAYFLAVIARHACCFLAPSRRCCLIMSSGRRWPHEPRPTLQSNPKRHKLLSLLPYYS